MRGGPGREALRSKPPALLSVADGGWAVDQTEGLVAVGVVVTIVPGGTRKLCLPFAAAPRKPETFLSASDTDLPDRHVTPEAAGWAGW